VVAAENDDEWCCDELQYTQPGSHAPGLRGALGGVLRISSRVTVREWSATLGPVREIVSSKCEPVCHW